MSAKSRDVTPVNPANNNLPTKIRKALTQGLRVMEMEGKVDVEKSTIPGKYRAWVISSDFGESHAERQEVVWRILKDNLPARELVKLAMVFTFTPKELKGDFS